jgi:sugar fermentation stimulation protein A
MQEPCAGPFDVVFPPLIPAVMRERPHRFLLLVEVAGRRVPVACGDPGRLERLLVPGARLLLAAAPAGSALRRTAFTAVLVQAGRGWVSIQPALANRIVQFALERDGLPELAGAKVLSCEIRHGASRIDFLLRHRGQNLLAEVKSATWVIGRRALFPDAPTERGTRHVRELAACARSGSRAALIFVVQRRDAASIAPHAGRDPAFAAALRDAHAAGVEVLAYRASITARGCRLLDGIPVLLGPPGS